MDEPQQERRARDAARGPSRIREALPPLVVFAALWGACEWGADRYYYAKTYDYYHAAEVYWEEQSTLLLYLPHRYLFWTLKPGIRMKAQEVAETFGLRPEHNGRKRYDWEIRVSPQGFRGAAFPEQRPKAELRVACFGDSRTIGESLEESQSYEARLTARLESAFPGRPIRVLNLGADGWSSHQGLTLLERQARDYAPDVAVFAFGINDTDTDWNMDDTERARLMDKPAVTIQRTLFRSMAFYWAERQFLWAKGRLFGRSRVVRPERDRRGGRAVRVGLPQYAENLRRFARGCRSAQIRPLLLVIPVNPYQDWEPFTPELAPPRETAGREALAAARAPASQEPLEHLARLAAQEPSFYPGRYAFARELREHGELAAAHREFCAARELAVFAAYNREAEATAVREQIPVVDVRADFEAVLPYEPLYADEMHPNARGAELIARLLGEQIRQMFEAPPR